MRGRNAQSTNASTIRARGPDQRIDQQCDEAAADAGQRHLDGHELGRIDVKLI